ncbi:hypothetical protein AB0D15_28140, partial [Streptomyces sp. NPDC048551]
MPDPGPSPLQSSLPAAAARFGAHGHGRGTEALDAVRSAPDDLPPAPATPAAPAYTYTLPSTGTVPTARPAPPPDAGPVAEGASAVVCSRSMASVA